MCMRQVEWKVGEWPFRGRESILPRDWADAIIRLAVHRGLTESKGYGYFFPKNKILCPARPVRPRAALSFDSAA